MSTKQDLEKQNTGWLAKLRVAAKVSTAVTENHPQLEVKNGPDWCENSVGQNIAKSHHPRQHRHLRHWHGVSETVKDISRQCLDSLGDRLGLRCSDAAMQQALEHDAISQGD